MINGGLRFYNTRSDIGGFVSTVRSGRTATGWSDPRFALFFFPNFFCPSRRRFGSLPSARLPLLWEFVPFLVYVYMCVCVCCMPRRVDDEISRFEKFTSGPRASRHCLLCFLRRSLPRFELLDQPCPSWELPIITSSTVAHPWPCNSQWLDIFQGKSVSRHCTVSLYPGNFQEIYQLYRPYVACLRLIVTYYYRCLLIRVYFEEFIVKLNYINTWGRIYWDT